MKIYTKKGDEGQTSLASGQRVSKADPRVDLYGLADELNSRIGFGFSMIDKKLQKSFQELQTVQIKIFELSSELAGFNNKTSIGAIQPADIEFLEKSIDAKELELAKLKSFILPGGNPAAACMHLARTACRQLERRMIEVINQNNKIQPDFIKENTLAWVNRLSDYCFVMARYINLKTNTDDIKWE